jgi:hypothetical protein
MLCIHWIPPSRAYISYYMEMHAQSYSINVCYCCGTADRPRTKTHCRRPQDMMDPGITVSRSCNMFWQTLCMSLNINISIYIYMSTDLGSFAIFMVF